MTPSKNESEHGFDPSLITRAARDALSVSRVFGEAYQHEGTTIIPVARLIGGTGSGSGGGSLTGNGGEEEKPSGNGDGYGAGGGFGVCVKPLGVLVVDASGTRWKPTIDVNRVILGGQIVGAITVLTVGTVLRRWLRRHH